MISWSSNNKKRIPFKPWERGSAMNGHSTYFYYYWNKFLWWHLLAREYSFNGTKYNGSRISCFTIAICPNRKHRFTNFFFFVPSLQCTTRRFNIAARRTQTENELKRVQQIMRENKEMEEREWHRRKKDYSIYFIRFPLNYCHFFTNQLAWFGERFWFTKRRSSAI